MKLIIDIPEEAYKEYMSVQLARSNGKSFVAGLLEAVKKGIQLSDVINEFQVYREYSSNMNNNDWVDRIENVLNHLPPVTPKISKKIYVVTQILEYQDFETHYETKVLEVFSTKEAAQAFIDSKPEIEDTHIKIFVENFYGDVTYDIIESEVKSNG